MRNRLLNLLQRNKGRGRFEIKNEAAEATIYLYDMIVDTDADAEWFGGVSAESFVKQLAAIDAPTIHLRINSPGGSVFGGRAMELALRQSKANIVAHIDGVAASAASLVAMAGNEIEIAKGGFLMIHRAWSFAMGNTEDFTHEAELLAKIDGTIAQTYVDRTGAKLEDVTAMMVAETWIDGAEAVARGFADRVAEDAPSASAWDLSAFDHAPKDEHTITVNIDASQVEAAVKNALDAVANDAAKDARKRAVLRKLIPA